MQKVNTKWTLGNFSVALETEVSDEDQKLLASLGLKYLGQRVSAVDRVMGGFTKTADGKEKRKVGWKRGDVPFGQAMAQAVGACFDTLEFPDSTKDVPHKLSALVEITEYVPETATPKFVDEKAIALRHESKGDLEAWLKSDVGFDGPTHGEDGEYAIPMLQAIKEYKLAKLAAM